MKKNNVNKQKYFLVWIIFLILISTYLNSIAQTNEIKFTNITTEDGISLNSVTGILQDSKGFLWFGTYNGLNRYDGYNFKYFLPDQSNKTAISNHAIGPMVEDKDGYIWIGTLDGLNRYDSRKENFKVYKNSSKDPHSISNNYIYSIYEDREGELWFGTLNGLCRYNRKTDNFTTIKYVYSELNPDSLNSVITISEDSDGQLWLGTWNGLTCMDKSGKIKHEYFAEPLSTKSFDYRKITFVFEDKNKKLWIGTNKSGLYNFNRRTGEFIQYRTGKDPNSISNDFISTIFQDRSGNLWIGTQDGFNKYNPEPDNFTRYLNDPAKPYSIINDEIYAIAEDNTGMLWIGTTGGVSRFSQHKNNFFYYTEQNGLSDNRIYSVETDRKGNTWVGTFNGMDKIDSKGNIFHYKHEKNKNSLSHNYVMSIKEDHLGYMWIGTQDDGINMFNPATGKFKCYNYDIRDTQSISNSGVTAICEDHTGTMWFGTWWGLNRFDRKTEKFYRYLNDPLDTNTLRRDLIWVVYEDSEGMIWIGTDGGGVSRLDPKTNRFTHFTRESPISNKISENRVFTIFESSDKVMWFGTSEGLNSYNRKTGEIVIYKLKDGLPGNLISSIVEDNKANLWIGTDRGLSKFDRDRNIFINYTKRNGVNELEFYMNVVSKSPSGYFYFGGRLGLMYFHPDSIKSEILNAPVVFTDLKIYNQSVTIEKNGILEQSIVGSKTIKIPSDKEVITFNFALLDFFDSKKNTFRYKLVGFDKGWNEVGTRNDATYTNLPPGEYTFIVRASNNNGLKNEKEASIQIEIVPAYFQTWWFKSGIAAIVLMVIIVLSQARTRVIKRQNKILEGKVAERTKDLDETIKELSLEIASKNKFFSIIAHDLRSPFTAMMGLAKYLYDEINNISKDELHFVADNLLKSTKVTFNLLENLLQWARIKTGKIIFHPIQINLKKLIEDVTELYKSNAVAKTISIISEVKREIMIIADQNMIESILRNLISNAIKFTPAGGNIYIRMKDNSDWVEVSITDTGIGLSMEKLNRLFLFEQNVSSLGTQNERGSGLGLILCKEFVEIHKGKITINSKPEEGSTFSFTMPKRPITE